MVDVFKRLQKYDISPALMFSLSAALGLDCVFVFILGPVYLCFLFVFVWLLIPGKTRL